MLNRTKRKPGGQPGNRNAVKTGYWTKEARAARQAACEARHAAWLEECRRSDEWRAQPRFVTDYGKIIEAIKRARAELEARRVAHLSRVRNGRQD